MSGLLYTSQRFSCTPALRMLLCGKYIALSSLIESVVGFIVITKIMKIFQLAGLLDFRSVAASAAPFGAVAFVFLLFGRGEATSFLVLRREAPGVKITRAPFTSAWVTDFLSLAPLLDNERRKLPNSPNWTIRPARSSMSRMKLRLSNTAFTSALETVDRAPIMTHNVSMSVCPL